MKVTTKMGDHGETSIFNEKVKKNDIIIDTLGSLDELSAYIIELANNYPETLTISKHIVEDLSLICSIISGYLSSDLFTKDKITWLEQTMNENKLNDDFVFIYPFENKKASSLNLLRTITRRSERIMYCLNDSKPICDNILSYMNRLSDFWFIYETIELIQNEGEHL